MAFKITPRHLPKFIAAFALLIMAGSWLSVRLFKGRPSPVEPSTAGPTQVTKAADPSACQRVATFTFVATVESKTQLPGQPSRLIEASVNGRFQAVMAAASGARKLLLLTVTEVRNAPSKPNQIDLAKALAGQSIYAEYTADGRLRSYFGTPQQAPARLNAFKSLFIIWQFAQPAATDPGPLQIEADSEGLAQFRYQRLTQETFEKSKVGYQQLWRASNKRPMVKASQHRLKVDATGYLLQVDATESSVLTLEQGGQAQTQWHTELNADVGLQTLCHLPSDTPSIAQLQASLQLVDLGVAAALPAPMDDPGFRRAVLERRIPDLLAALKRGDSKTTSEAQFFLTKRLELSPTDIPAVATEVLAQSSDTAYAQTLIGAIASAEGAVAQATLLELMRVFDGRGSIDLLEFTARSHLLSPSPARTNIDFLLALSDQTTDPERKSNALLAATAAASKLPPAANAEIAAVVLQAAQSAPAQFKPSYVAALGNLSNAATVPQLMGIAAGTDIALAADALTALGSTPNSADQDVDLLLLSFAAANTKTLRLRQAAVEAMRSRPLDERIIRALIAVHAQASSPELLAACLTTIGAWEHRFWPVVDEFLSAQRRRPNLSEAEKQALVNLQ